MSCATCGATLAIPSLRDAYAAVEKMAPLLKANLAKPPPEVLKRRLAAIDGDLPRRREFVAGLEKEAWERRGYREPFDWSSLEGAWHQPGPRRADRRRHLAGVAAVLALSWPAARR